MAKVVCVLYDDPVTGYPKTYARDGLPKLDRYPGGQTLPTPKAIDFRPGDLLGSVSGALGLRKYLEGAGHTLVVTSDKDGPNSAFEREIVDAEIVISQPFWPAYLTAERIAKAPKLKMAITAGIGSDHVDLSAAMARGITVTEVTYCNSISVAEHVVMMILGLVRNYIPSYQWVIKGGWNIADCVARSYDVEGMSVGTVAAGRIGLAVLKRLKPFDMKLHYTDRHRLPEAVEKELGLTFHKSAADMVPHCDVVTINAPLHPETENLFNDKLIATSESFTFKDLRALRTLIDLRAGKISSAQIQNVVAALREKLGGVPNPLAEVKIHLRGRRILAREEHHAAERGRIRRHGVRQGPGIDRGAERGPDVGCGIEGEQPTDGRVGRSAVEHELVNVLVPGAGRERARGRHRAGDGQRAPPRIGTEDPGVGEVRRALAAEHVDLARRGIDAVTARTARRRVRASEHRPGDPAICDVEGPGVAHVAVGEHAGAPAVIEKLLHRRNPLQQRIEPR